VSARRPPLRRAAGLLAIHAVLLLCGAAVAFPFFWMVSTSLKTQGEALAFPPILWPAACQWGNYADAWNVTPHFGRYFLNSAFIAGSVTLSVIVSALLAGYAFGQMEFPGRSALFAAYLATMMIPFEVVLIPNFLMINRLGWYDTYWAMIVPWGANVFSVFLLNQFFRGLPRDFFEAAQLDGCGHWQYLWRVGAPLARPALATAGLFAFLGSWNSLLWPLLVTSTEALRPLEVGLQSFLQAEAPRPHLLMAASTLAMLPILALFFVAQRTFIEGVSAGVKA
jgi:ABC-type glycerol-3-phosphate transport system permease component